MIEIIKEKIRVLNEAAKAYYQNGKEIMTNYEYDKLYDELIQLEKETGIILSNSPTQNVGYEVVSELPKEEHPSEMLSLNKTKDVDELKAFLGDRVGTLSFKEDGLTVVAYYSGGQFVKAVTRGDGIAGSVVTNNYKHFKNVPLQISYKGDLVIRGEAVMTYEDFDRINDSLPEGVESYKNPRNLCAGTVINFDSSVVADRNIRYIPFTLVSADGKDFSDSKNNQLNWLESLGFEPVERRLVDAENFDKVFNYFKEAAKKQNIPSDGLVLQFDEIEYSKSLGKTSKFPKDGLAFKWEDATEKTILRSVEWNTSRTGRINPVAIFNPVELEGTTVTRATIHNVSILKDFKLGIGDELLVAKANLIIPMIVENLAKSDSVKIPNTCPVCGHEAVIKINEDAEVLYCTNPECVAKKIKAFTHFVSKEGLDIDGMSESTIEKFVKKGFIKECADIFRLSEHKEEILSMDGFGEKTYNNLVNATNKASKTTVNKLLYSLGINNVGTYASKLIAKNFDYDWDKVSSATYEELISISDIGPVLAQDFVNFFKKEENKKMIENLLKYLEFEGIKKNTDDSLKGKVFVITGSVEHFPNRNALKDYIESKGGKVVSSVSANTTYLINNDVGSNSSKNKKAKELGVQIISEEDFLKL